MGLSLLAVGVPSEGIFLLWGAGLVCGAAVAWALRLSSSVTVLSGLGDAPGIRFPSLMEACSGSRSQVDESRTFTRRSV